MSNERQTSPLPENSAEEEEDKKLQEVPSQEPTGGGGRDERKVATLPHCSQKTSIAIKGPILKPCAANAIDSDTIKEMIYATLASFKEGNIPPRPLGLKFTPFTDLELERLQASLNLDSLRLPLGTPDKRPFENSAKDGVSQTQGKEEKIKDEVHGEDGEGEGEGEGEGGGEENPRDDSASI